MAGSLPSGETSEASASTRCQARLSCRALLLECSSLRRPRPQRSRLEVSSHSMTPFAPRNIDTTPSRPCEAKGMHTPLHFFNAAATSGLPATCGKCGEPISSSPSATKTRRSEEHTSELQSRFDLVCRLLLEKKKNKHQDTHLSQPN